MNRDEVNSAKKSREIGRQLTRDSATSQKVLIQVLENVGNPDKKGYFEIKVGDKTFLARQLG
ncbi:MAG: hypothetical protein JJU28_01360 [Cyclobacteriaceae bacterium]|nr:hypothetical protein [Cyclobacteriaceae bacterium]